MGAAMLKKIFLLTLFALINQYFLKIAYADLFTQMVNYNDRHGVLFFVCALGGAVVLIFLSYLFVPMGLYRLADLLAQIVLQLSQFGLLALSVLNIVFWFFLDEPFFATTSSLPLAFFLTTLLGSSFALRIVDFNFPIRQAISPFALIAFISWLVIATISFAV